MIGSGLSNGSLDPKNPVMIKKASTRKDPRLKGITGSPENPFIGWLKPDKRLIKLWGMTANTKKDSKTASAPPII